MTTGKTPKRTRLVDALPPDDKTMAKFDATLGTAQARGVGGRRGRHDTLSRHTQRAYERWLRYYQQWCADEGLQPELTFLTDEKARDFAASLTQPAEDRYRYAPQSVQQALTALRYWANKAQVHPLPSFDPAYAELHRYIAVLRDAGVIESRVRTRIRPVGEVE